MLPESSINLAAKELLNRRSAMNKSFRLEDNVRPISIEDGLAIQMETVKQSKDSIGGWKCLLPPNDEQVIVAPILKSSIESGDNCELFADNCMARLEPEIAFVLAKDLPAQDTDYSESEIDQAIGSAHMALELMQDRFISDCGVDYFERLADCLLNQGIFLGPEINLEQAYKAATINISFSQGDNVQEFSGKHPNQSPIKPLYWMINYLGKRGVSFKAGQAIITASYAGIVEVDFEKLTEIAYQNLGKYSVTFNAK
ncbi:hydratase [Thalassomonas sp. M1454]|uniref:hydratase n=1 Tax=Thalassomonas sp. M1454 TaxID=2594477 RepID=UPI00117F28E4|nr:hydratase [Thalassomonas sp. M1454]TRX55728.1 hydratase [Thalassomonas sp. M1454]